MKRSINMRLPDKTLQRLALLAGLHKRSRTEVVVASVLAFYEQSFGSKVLPSEAKASKPVDHDVVVECVEPEPAVFE